MHPTRIFENEEKLLQAWNSYKEGLKEQAMQWPKIQYVGKDGTRVTDYPIVPYTLEGFKRYCRENHGDVSNYFDNSGELYNDFKAICSRIREEIREQQIIGGMLGFYNPSITQRLNNLTEKQDVTSQGQAITNVKVEIIKSDTPISNNEKDVDV